MLRDYFNSLALSLSAESASASLGGHRPDTGANRESLLIRILNNHLPERLRAIPGGTVVNLEGELSKQIDIIVKNDLFPKFEQHEKSCVLSESVAGVLSVKSHLDKASLEEAIENVASVPEFSDATLSLSNSSIVRADLAAKFKTNWPLRAVFAYDSIDPDRVYKHSLAYFNANKDRTSKFPEMIVVNRRLCVRFLREGGTLQDGTKLPPNYMNPMLLTDSTCGYPLAGIVTTLNNYVPWMHYMKMTFSPYVDKAYSQTCADSHDSQQRSNNARYLTAGRDPTACTRAVVLAAAAAYGERYA